MGDGDVNWDLALRSVRGFLLALTLTAAFGTAPVVAAQASEPTEPHEELERLAEEFEQRANAILEENARDPGRNAPPEEPFYPDDSDHWSLLPRVQQAFDSLSRASRDAMRSLMASTREAWRRLTTCAELNDDVIVGTTPPFVDISVTFPVECLREPSPEGSRPGSLADDAPWGAGAVPLVPTAGSSTARSPAHPAGPRLSSSSRLAPARASGRKLGRPKGSLGVSRLDGKEDEIRRLPRAEAFQLDVSRVSHFQYDQKTGRVTNWFRAVSFSLGTVIDINLPTSARRHPIFARGRAHDVAR